MASNQAIIDDRMVSNYMYIQCADSGSGIGRTSSCANYPFQPQSMLYISTQTFFSLASSAWLPYIFFILSFHGTISVSQIHSFLLSFAEHSFHFIHSISSTIALFGNIELHSSLNIFEGEYKLTAKRFTER